MLVRASSGTETRAGVIRKIEDALGHRKLYWFGPRGADARALLALDQFAGSFSIMAPLEAVSVESDVCLETMTKQRVDHNTYSFDDDHSEALREFRVRLLDALRLPAAVVPYRSNRFLSNILFPRAETTTYLGLFHEQQSQFEHKPWVETELKRLGVRTLPWVYFADEDRPRLLDYLANVGPIVLRASRSDGGARVEMITTPRSLANHIPSHDDGFLCACKFFPDAIPLNLNACIYRDGTITMHGLSEQIIGHPALTRRTFGYCGNRFGIANRLHRKILDQFEAYIRLTGQWLHRQGYVGVFGIDALFAEDELYLVEVNPRFQGSSYAVGLMDCENNLPDLYLSQLAAFLGLPAPNPRPLYEVAAGQRPSTLVIVYNLNPDKVGLHVPLRPVALAGAEIDLLPRSGTDIHPEAITARVVLAGADTLEDLRVIDLLDQLQGTPLQSVLFKGDTVR